MYLGHVLENARLMSRIRTVILLRKTGTCSFAVWKQNDRLPQGPEEDLILGEALDSRTGNISDRTFSETLRLCSWERKLKPSKEIAMSLIPSVPGGLPDALGYLQTG